MSNSKNNEINPVAAGVAGAIIGAGVAVAATKVISDQKLRKRIQIQASKYSQLIKSAIDNMRDAAEKRLEARVVEPTTPTKKTNPALPKSKD